ncbi:MAG: bifunctional adenosylcobinamide kinase/adenosylcobinamide-phosphate guanylyltransferase, partial [Desertimonas sp.]
SVVEQAARLAAAMAHRATPTVVITNEVGMGVHPETELGRRYRDVLGRANQVLAAGAERSLLLVAGRALRLDDPPSEP